jgi:AAA domain-containing protein/RNase H-like protein
MGKYATRETEVDDLLRGDVFVDLYNVVRQGFIIGTPSYSLKDIEHLYLERRTGPVLSAGGSVVEYQKWIDSGQPRRWQESPLLDGIREYNRLDCESVWALRSWLRERQCESGIAWVPSPVCHPERSEGGMTQGMAPSVVALPQDDSVVIRLLERAKTATDAEQSRLDQLLAWLVDFHRREERPMWWRMFDRHDMTVEERFDDRDCLAGLTRTARAAWKAQRSLGLEYRYDPAQETKLEAGDRCFVAGTELRAEIVAMNEDEGLVELKASKPLPDRLCLIPDEFVSAEVIKAAIARYAAAWERGEVLSQAVDDLLRRRPPRITGHPGGPLVPATEDLVERTCDLAARLEQSTLCIQGPPGAGKTFTAAAIVVALLRRGARIGVTAQSHKVVMNAMRAVAKALAGTGIAARLYKVGDHDDDPLVQQGTVLAIGNDDVPGALDVGACLVGGTAWLFSCEELASRFDYIVIDEAGQVSLANAVAVGLAARNLILVGDQMQLSQVTQGHHPGDTGLSCLEYLLHGRATVPQDLGVFLEQTRRMHPDVCRFISDAVYEGRLGTIAATARHRVIHSGDTRVVPAETGIVWVPVEHDGCAQSSEEECDTIVGIVKELLARRVVDRDGVERSMTENDILIVAPFNLQVRCLRDRLDPRIRIGSVDKFQGQEAPVVIVSLCASTLEEAPRGASFLLNPNRLNVAVSRAEALAIVVGCPELMDVRCRSVEEMRPVNLLCHLVQYAEEARQA